LIWVLLEWIREADVCVASLPDLAFFTRSITGKGKPWLDCSVVSNTDLMLQSDRPAELPHFPTPRQHRGYGPSSSTASQLPKQDRPAVCILATVLGPDNDSRLRKASSYGSLIWQQSMVYLLITFSGSLPFQAHKTGHLERDERTEMGRVATPRGHGMWRR
jgi:hypothetical protein